MSVDVKALRALLAKEKEARIDRHAGERGFDAWDHADEVLKIAAVNALPDLLALAEAVRELAGPIAMLVEHGDIAERDAARRVLAILDPTNAGDGR